jgi:CheY-like chemotaxis protein
MIDNLAEKPQTPRVLLVDDMDMILFVIKGQLLRYGLQVDTASSGAEAVEKTKNNVYDLVFMDHLMPEMDGIQAVGEIRKWEDEEYQRKHGMEFPQETPELPGADVCEGKRLPIIALTANMESGAEEKFFANGFNGFLTKPVVKHKLEEILKKWLPQAVGL